jgi:hypothetical protein
LYRLVFAQPAIPTVDAAGTFEAERGNGALRFGLRVEIMANAPKKAFPFN